MKIIKNTEELKKAANAVYLATDELSVANHLSSLLSSAAETIDELQDFVILLMDFGYNFSQYEYFCRRMDKLLKETDNDD